MQDRVFVGPNGGLVVAFRHDVPARIRIKSASELSAFQACIAESTEFDSSEIAGVRSHSKRRICRPGVFDGVPLLPGGEVEEVTNESDESSHTFVLNPGDAPSFDVEWLRPHGLLDQQLERLEDKLRRHLGAVEVLDLAGQQQHCRGDTLVKDVLQWIKNHGLPVQALDMSSCFITDVGAQCIVAEMRHWPWLERVSLAENALTTRGAADILTAAQFQRRTDSVLSIDLAYNAIPDPAELIAPGSSIRLNVGPAWTETEALRTYHCANMGESAREWALFMHGPASKLGQELNRFMKEWRCPLCDCLLRPVMLRVDDTVSFEDHIWNHLRGKVHMRKVFEKLGTESDDDLVLRFPVTIDRNHWCYWFHAFKGTQGWQRPSIDWSPRDVDFIRRPMMAQQVLGPLVYPANCEIDGTCLAYQHHESDGSSTADLLWLFRAVINEVVDIGVDLYKRFELPEELCVEAVFEDYNDGQPFRIVFAWRSYLERHAEKLGRAVLDHAHRAFLEIFPPPAKDFMGNPPLYLVVEGVDGFSALLKPRQIPLFADAAGIIVGRGSRPGEVRGPMFACKPAEVKEAFHGGSMDNVQSRARLRSGRTGDCSVEAFLLTLGITMNDLVEDERVQLNPETHAFEVDHELSCGYWDWLADGRWSVGSTPNAASASQCSRVRQPESAVYGGCGSQPSGSAVSGGCGSQPSGSAVSGGCGSQLGYEYYAKARERWRLLSKLQERLKTIFQASQCDRSWFCPSCGREHSRWSERCDYATSARTWECTFCQKWGSTAGNNELQEAIASFESTPWSREDLPNIWDALQGALTHGLSVGSPENLQYLLHCLDDYLRVKEERLPVSAIRATHDMVSARFRHGRHEGQPLQQLVNDLKRGSNFGLVNVRDGTFVLEGAFHRGQFRCIANRRTKCVWDAFGKHTNALVAVRIFPLAPGFRTELDQDFLYKFVNACTSSSDGRNLEVRTRACMGQDRFASRSSERPGCVYALSSSPPIKKCIASSQPASSCDPVVGVDVWLAIANFEAGEYGAEYMDLMEGDHVTKLSNPEESDDWWYGKTVQRSGWFPATFVRRHSSRTSLIEV